MAANIQMITPFLWFADQAEEAVKFYTSFFDNTKIHKITRYDEESAKAAGLPAGSVMAVEFQLEGQQFIAMNGGPQFRINQTVSFMVNCDSQEDVDYYWERLAEEARVQDLENSWLRDKYGVSWQIIPTWLIGLAEDPDQDKKERFMQALMNMKKIGKEFAKKAA